MQKSRVKSGTEMLSRVGDLLRELRGVQFPDLAVSFLQDRIYSRMKHSHASSEEAYLETLKKQPAEMDRLIHDLTINVSRFFRDVGCFDLLSQYFIPVLMDEKAGSGKQEIRIWSAGCSAGEEAYSMAILMQHQMKQFALTPPLRIFATDISEEMLKKAKSAHYHASSLQETSFANVQTYFQQENDTFRLSPEITKMVQFFRHDLLDEKSYVPRESIFGNFDMVLCRNVMIYMNKEHHAAVFLKLWKALRPGGILVLGQFELPPREFSERFTQESRFYKIYRKNHAKERA